MIYYAEFYQTMANPCYEKMIEVLTELQKDIDQDVRYFSSCNLSNNLHSKQVVSIFHYYPCYGSFSSFSKMSIKKNYFHNDDEPNQF